jgi:hypothetical protein
MHSLPLLQRDEVVGVIPPPPGVTPNFIDPVSKAHVVIITVIVVTSISAFSTGIRHYTALFITRHVRIDDCKPYRLSCKGALLTSADLLLVAWVSSLQLTHNDTLLNITALSFSLLYPESSSALVGDLCILADIGVDEILPGTKYGVGRHLWDVPFAIFNPNFMKVSISLENTSCRCGN